MINSDHGTRTRLTLILPLLGFVFTSAMCQMLGKPSKYITPPEVTILSPRDKASFEEGEEILIRTEVTKTFEIVDSYIEVTSSDESRKIHFLVNDQRVYKDLYLSDLKQGEHTITLYAMDKRNQKNEHSITINVRGKDSDKPPLAKSEDRKTIKAHGQACEEDEGSIRKYRWQLDLFERDGIYLGSLYFHDCPDGGSILYTVKEISRQGNSIILKGKNQRDGTGSINLHPAAIDEQIFDFDVESKTITPNLAEEY